MSRSCPPFGRASPPVGPRPAPFGVWSAFFLASLLVGSEGVARIRQSEAASTGALRSAIEQLGTLDYASRRDAARAVRRAPASQAVVALEHAVAEHSDSYVRFRALVLLSGFNDPRTRDAMIRVAADRNDRLREVAYAYFEYHPDPSEVTRLLGALEREEAEFVRPALVRALAAHANDARVRDALLVEVGRGQDFFRSAVIEALGDHRAVYAVSALEHIARLDGPLQDDAALALGKIGEKRALDTLATVQRSAPRASQPAIAAAICLLGVNCDAHLGYLAKTLRFAVETPGFQDLLRGAAASLGAVAAAGHAAAADVLLNVGIPAEDPARAPIALGLATTALRNPSHMLAVLERRPGREPAIDLLRDGFDMLEEDFEEERFFATVRRAYWQAPEGSPARAVAALLIQKLEF